MNNKVLRMSMALPILFIQVGQSFTSHQALSLNTLPFSILSARMTEITFNIQHKSPFLLAARDDKKKECRWVGSCDDEVRLK